MQGLGGTVGGGSCQLPGTRRGSGTHVPQARHAQPSCCSTKRGPVSSSTVPHAVLGVGDLPKQSTPLPVSTSTQHVSAANIQAPQATNTECVQQGTAETQPAYTAPTVDTWREDPVLMSGCEPHAAPLQVAVLLSGGVDSSLALRLLVAAGHQCKAFYLQIWFQEDFRNFWDACPWEEDLKYAQQVCDSLGVPLEVVPMTNQYWDKVVSHSVEEIRSGRTPNPDMLCNSRVKFGAFLDHLDALQAAGGPWFDRVASGHYARLLRRSHGNSKASVPVSSTASVSSSTVSGNSHANGSLASTASHAGYVVSTPSLPVSAISPKAGTAELLAATPSSEGASSEGASLEGAHPEESSSEGASSEELPLEGGASEGASQLQEEVLLVLTPDAVKDQTYFLAHLTPRQLSRTMFPLGGLTKPQVRALATAAGLATQARKDSQGICFLGKVKFPEFVKEHLGEWQGLIVEHEPWQSQPPQPLPPQPPQPSQPLQAQQPTSVHQEDSSPQPSTSSNSRGGGSNGVSRSGESSSNGVNSDGTSNSSSRDASGSSKAVAGKVNKGGVAPTLALFGGHRVLGIHQGYWFYTVGQRGGIKLPGGPWYVTRKDCELNIVYVSRSYHEPGRQRNAFLTGPFSWLSARRPNLAHDAAPLLCKVRHGPHAYQCQLRPLPQSPSTSTSLQPAQSSFMSQGHDAAQRIHQQDRCAQDSNGAVLIQQANRSSLDRIGTTHWDEGAIRTQQANKGSLDSIGAIHWDEGAVVVLDGSDQGLAAGQYAVFYQDGVCLGTAKIEGCVDVERGYDGAAARGTTGTLSATGLQF